MTNTNGTELLTSVDISNVNWKVKTEDFTTFEFRTKENVESDEGYDYDLHRLFLHKDGSIDIQFANEEDYDIHEDVSNKFDLNNVAEYLLSQISELENITETYIAHYEEREANGEDVA